MRKHKGLYSLPGAYVMFKLLLLGPLAAAVASAGKTVHVLFSNHLDIGFDNIEPWVGWDSNVINMYFNRYLPLAVDVADWMQLVSPHQDRFIYTTHPYLISLFLDCPPGMGFDCPDEATKDKVLQGIQSGVITWQAHPHNAQYEFYDVSLLEFAFQLTHDLDRRFGLKPKHTVTLRDVPGLTRAAIPVLVSQGIKAVSVGVNGGSAPPGVPKFTPFIWRDEPSGTQLLAFWRPGGYGGVRGDWDVNLDPPHECIQAPGLDHVLCTSWRNDNAGPPLTVLEPLRIYDLLRQEWGGNSSSSSSSSNSGGSSDGSSNNEGVVIKGSSIDEFVDAVLEALPHLNLPVITGEIGDTWVFGVQSDPLKTANFRAVSRARAACIADPTCPSDTPAFYNFSRLLLKVPEHTWGVDIKKTLHDFANYSNTDFHSCLPAQSLTASTTTQPNGISGSPPDNSQAATRTMVSLQEHTHDPALPVRPAPCLNYEYCIHAWDRQAAYIDWALQALPPSHPVVVAFAADLAARQQLAGITADQLLAGGAKVHNVAEAAGLLSSEAPEEALAVTATSTTPTPATEAPGGTGAEQMLPAGDQQGLEGSETTQQQKLRRQRKEQRLPRNPESVAASRKLQAEHQLQHQQQQQQQQQDHQDHQQHQPPAAGRVRRYTCGSWRLELDEDQGGFTSLVKVYGSTAGNDWAGGAAGGTSHREKGRPPHGIGSPHHKQQPSNSRSSNKVHTQDLTAPVAADCEAAAGNGIGVLGQLVYHAYCEASYDFVWDHYSWRFPMPWWFPLDFGKVNSSAAWSKEVQVTARLEQVYETHSAAGHLQQLSLRYSFPQELVQQVGAPPEMWTTISCPSSASDAAATPQSSPTARAAPATAVASAAAGFSDELEVSVTWKNKTPTRLPEALWFSFQPDPSVVDPASWRLHKLGSTLHPSEVILNGSQSMHGVSEGGFSVTSKDGSEQLQVRTWDTALLSPGRPTPFPNGVYAPCMADGMHFNLMNNVWGTNYIMWVPYSDKDVDLAFRFTITASQLGSVRGHMKSEAK